MRGYERIGKAYGAIAKVLRIPMRGYEGRVRLGFPYPTFVTNPHAGL